MQGTSALSRLDQLITRLLLIKPQAHAPVQAQQVAAQAEWAYNYSLMLSAGRCVIQYIILPFILPLIGVAGQMATGISLVINVVAVAAILASVRRLWQINYSRKWAYLGVAVGALVFIAFFVMFDLGIIAR
jgi:ABC-type iron transport system FetAB permease component